MKNTWETYWGAYISLDLAPSLEEHYEKAFGKSAVYWVDGKNSFPCDTLADRPEWYEACGYTGDFDSWGIRSIVEAIDHGMDNMDDIYNYVISH